MKNKEFYKEQIYEVACKRDRFAVNKTTKEIDYCLEMNCCDCLFDSSHYCCGSRAMEWLEEEHVEPVLDDVEKRYLEAVLRPFRKRVKSIKKVLWSNDYTYIQIAIDCLCSSEYGYDYINLPIFVRSEMYKGMELGKQYTLKDLGLFE